MNCFMFPGQPLARGGESPADNDFREIAAMVRQRVALDLETFTWTGHGSTDNVSLQVYGTAMSLYEARRLRQNGVTPGIIAEHSMGIYAALAAAESLPEEGAVELAFRIGCSVARMGESGSYAIGCVVGLTLEPLLAVARNNRVYLANQNTSRHFLLSGELGNIETAMAEAVQAGAFSARTFSADGPLHTPLLEDVADDMRAVFADYGYREPVVPLLNHIDQRCLKAGDMADFMLREMLTPVYWEKSFHSLRQAGVDRFYEVGVGEALKKYNRWIESEL